MKVEVTIAQITGFEDPPPVAIMIKVGPRKILRVEMTAENFGLAVTGRLVFGIVTGGELKE